MDTSTKLYDYVMAQLRSKRVPQKTVSADSGVPFSTLTKIAQGLIKAPSVHHVQALYDYFTKETGGEAAQAAHDANVLAAMTPAKTLDLSRIEKDGA
jgi:hypothetical protein